VAGEPKRVVIVGAGFAGLRAARRLARAPVAVTLLDRKNHHTFQPLLYQVATAGLNASDIAYPIRAVLRRQRNARVLMAEVGAIDLAARRVETDGGALAYDYLIVATGATHSYFGHPEWAAVAPGLKSIEDALEIRRRVYTAYEAAEREADPVRQAGWLTFAVIGGGPTGVELAGALSEIALTTLKRDFRAIDPARARVVLLEGQDRVLPSFPPELGEAARRQLERIGVDVRRSARVTAIDERGLEIGAERIEARTILWAAGVAASPLARTLGVPLDAAGRVVVGDDLAIAGHPEVFVLGDLAAARSADGAPVPGLAPAAIQGGDHAARAIAADLAGRPRPRFRYRDKGTLATIGRSKAVADLGRLRFAGFFAWLVWWAVHIALLIGFRSRLLVMLGWMWAYFTFERGARLITGRLPALPRFGDGDATPAAAGDSRSRVDRGA
jgi:NADH dehydrogenase